MKHIFVFDQSKCSACSACMMGCLDQNDTDVVGGDLCYRKTFDNEDFDIRYYTEQYSH